MIPEGAVLIFEEDTVAGVVLSRGAAGIVEEHEGKQSASLGLLGHEFDENSAQADGFSGQGAAFAGCVVAFVENEIDDEEDRSKSFGKVDELGRAIGDAGVLDFLFGADEALGHGGEGDEECTCDLLGSESTEGAQGEGYLRLSVESWVAAGEDQAEAIVFEWQRLLLKGWIGLLRKVPHGLRWVGAIFPALLAAECVNRLVASGRDEPSAGIGGSSLLGPLLKGESEGLLGSFLGQVETAEEADQRGDDPAPFVAIDLLERSFFFSHRTTLKQA